VLLKVAFGVRFFRNERRFRKANNFDRKKSIPAQSVEIEMLPQCRGKLVAVCSSFLTWLNGARLPHCFVGVALLLTAAWSVMASDLIGQASIIDGDTHEINGTRNRLWGIDAPESTQLCRGSDSLQYRCGAQAANDLDGFIAQRPVSCTPITLDRYGRTVAAFSVAGVDLGDWLVRKGLALDWPQYSKGKYGAAQRDAEQAERGVWSGSYVEPWLYRACIRANGGSADCSDEPSAHP
jgi:endonuclease YncB( thermonuclease family)